MVKTIKNNYGIILVAAIAVLPLFVWIFMKPIADRFISTGALFRSLGQMAGLLGMAMISLNFVLTTRFQFLDRAFKGLNRVYSWHHAIGAVAFCLLLFHPVFLIIQYLTFSLQASFIFIFSLQDWPTTFGKLALLVLIILLVITFYLNFKYQNWKNTHKYLGIVLFLGSLHMVLVPSDISSNKILKYYMLGLAFLGGFSYLYRTIFRAYRKGEYAYKLEEVKKINDSVVELKLTPLSRKIKFLPGQFIFLRFEAEGVLSESHPFSITSLSLDQSSLSLGIKTLGDYTSMVYLLKPGSICRIEGPFGSFSYKKASSKKQIWVAGGIGITPFLSMARDVSASGDEFKDYDINLYYSVKNPEEASFSEELSNISKLSNNFKFHQHFSEKEGYISARHTINDSKNMEDVEVFLCGPDSFMQSLRSQFVKLGLANDKIHSEEFSLQA